MKQMLLVLIILALLAGVISAAPAEQRVIITAIWPVIVMPRGSDGLWYILCLDQCEGIVTAVPINEFYRGFGSMEDARTYYNSVVVPRLIGLGATP